MEELGKNERVTDAVGRAMAAKGRLDDGAKRAVGQVGLAAAEVWRPAHRAAGEALAGSARDAQARCEAANGQAANDHDYHACEEAGGAEAAAGARAAQPGVLSRSAEGHDLERRGRRPRLLPVQLHRHRRRRAYDDAAPRSASAFGCGRCVPVDPKRQREVAA